MAGRLFPHHFVCIEALNVVSFPNFLPKICFLDFLNFMNICKKLFSICKQSSHTTMGLYRFSYFWNEIFLNTVIEMSIRYILPARLVSRSINSSMCFAVIWHGCFSMPVIVSHFYPCKKFIDNGTRCNDCLIVLLCDQVSLPKLLIWIKSYDHWNRISFLSLLRFFASLTDRYINCWIVELLRRGES